MRFKAFHIFPSPEQVVRRALALSPAHHEDLIGVAGPDGLDAMVSLCRAGYERVECARQATCNGFDEAADMLFVVGPMTPEELGDTVHAARPAYMRDDGVLIAQLSAAGQPSAVLRAALTRAGLRATLHPHWTAPPARLVMHRVRRVAALRRICMMPPPGIAVPLPARADAGATGSDDNRRRGPASLGHRRGSPPARARRARPRRCEPGLTRPSYSTTAGANLTLRVGVALFRAGLAPRALLLRNASPQPPSLEARNDQHRRGRRPFRRWRPTARRRREDLPLKTPLRDGLGGAQQHF